MASEQPPARRGGLRRFALDLTPLQRSRDYRLLMGGQMVSLLGRNLTLVAVPYQVFVLTRSTLAVGIVGLVQAVPIVATSLYSGTVADRVDRRVVLLLALAFQGLTSALLALGAVGLRAPLLYIYGVTAMAAAISAFELPARSALVPRLVGPELLPSALSLNQVVFQTGFVVGPGLAGVIISGAGLPFAYAIDAATFAVAIGTAWLMSPQPPLAGEDRPHLNIAAPLRAIRYVGTKPVLVAIFLIDLDAMVFGMPRAVFPELATQVFKVGPTGLGLLYAAPGAGALIAALASGWSRHVVRRGLVVFCSVVAWGIGITLFGLTILDHGLFGPALIFLAAAGGADVFSAVFRHTILQLSVPDEWRGRVSALNGMVINSGPRLGDLETGIVAALTNPFVAVISGALLSIVGAVGLWLASPALRRYRAAAPDEGELLREGPEPQPAT